MMNIGYRPTVDGSKKVIEVNIFDFDRDDLWQVAESLCKKISPRAKKNSMASMN